MIKIQLNFFSSLIARAEAAAECKWSSEKEQNECDDHSIWTAIFLWYSMNMSHHRCRRLLLRRWSWVRYHNNWPWLRSILLRWELLLLVLLRWVLWLHHLLLGWWATIALVCRWEVVWWWLTHHRWLSHHRRLSWWWSHRWLSTWWTHHWWRHHRWSSWWCTIWVSSKWLLLTVVLWLIHILFLFFEN